MITERNRVRKHPGNAYTRWPSSPRCPQACRRRRARAVDVDDIEGPLAGGANLVGQFATFPDQGENRKFLGASAFNAIFVS
jgi:hypothetical protein